MDGVANGLCMNILFHVSLEKKLGWRSNKCLVCMIFIEKDCIEMSEPFRTSCNTFRARTPNPKRSNCHEAATSRLGTETAS